MRSFLTENFFPYIINFGINGYDLDVDEYSSTLYVGCIPNYTTKEKLHSLFAGFGKIKRLIIKLKGGEVSDYNFAFVNYETVGSAASALKASKKKKFKIDGRAVWVEMKRNHY